MIIFNSLGQGKSRLLSATLRWWPLLVLSAVCLVLTACGTTTPTPEDTGSRTHRIYVTSNGWHTAIVVSAPALIATGALPEVADFPNAAFFEFGWGDRSYYLAEKKTLGMTLSAVLVKTSTVMHMVALEAPPEEDEEYDVISIELTEEGFQHLVQAISEEFERPPGGRAEAVSRGLYLDSYFYHARGKFHLFNTCNTWTALMLHASGIPISPSGIVTANGLMARLRITLKYEY